MNWETGHTFRRVASDRRMDVLVDTDVRGTDHLAPGSGLLAAEQVEELVDDALQWGGCA